MLDMGRIYYFFCAVLYLTIISIGVCNLRSNIFMDCKPQHRLSQKIALTIDDGPDVNFTIPLLCLLKKHGIHATFFLVGKESEKYPDLVKKIAQDGHSIAFHGYSHSPWSNFYLACDWEKEFQKAESILGIYLKKKWFRPPFALISPHLAYVLEKLQYTLVSFHIRALDFGNRRIHRLSERLLKKLSPGGVVMIHGSVQANAYQKEKILAEFDTFFQKIKTSGYEILTLENYLELDSKSLDKSRNVL